MYGFSRTVLPQLERALIAGHDVVLLGERGQGKTRLLRTLSGLLDEWSPVIAGSEIGEHPYEPLTTASQRRAAELGDDLPISWRPREERYVEKLATPDTSVADLIGDVDPMKVAEGRVLGDPETIHFGLVPRSHRGIVAINELPDLAERIQVAIDRKSTRLNSSHANISYAVFCLKKKKPIIAGFCNVINAVALGRGYKHHTLHVGSIENKSKQYVTMSVE